MKQATLCFLIRGNQGERELLLAMKKTGFGEGKWNGIGGRLDLGRKSESISETAIREVEEEIGIKIKDIEKVAILNFSHPYFLNSEEKEWQVHVFFAKQWEGEPLESKEMKPSWFKINELPFDEMWLDRKFWLPRVLNGEKLEGNFVYKTDEIIASYNINPLKNYVE